MVAAYDCGQKCKISSAMVKSTFKPRDFTRIFILPNNGNPTDNSSIIIAFQQLL
jgi:hypothetical protein